MFATWVRALIFAGMAWYGLSAVGLDGYGPMLAAGLILIMLVFGVLQRWAYGLAVLAALAGIGATIGDDNRRTLASAADSAGSWLGVTLPRPVGASEPEPRRGTPDRP